MTSRDILSYFFEEQWTHTHNTFRDCCVHFFLTTFLYIAVYMHFPNTLAKVFKKNSQGKREKRFSF